MRRLITALVKGGSRDNWSREQWYDHLLAHAYSQSEKDDIHAMFNRA